MSDETRQEVFEALVAEREHDGELWAQRFAEAQPEGFTITFESGEAVRVQPGGVYLLRTDSVMPQDTIESIMDLWRANAPDDARLILVDGAMRISEVTDEQLRELHEATSAPPAEDAESGRETLEPGGTEAEREQRERRRRAPLRKPRGPNPLGRGDDKPWRV